MGKVGMKTKMGREGFAKVQVSCIFQAGRMQDEKREELSKQREQHMQMKVS